MQQEDDYLTALGTVRTFKIEENGQWCSSERRRTPSLDTTLSSSPPPDKQNRSVGGMRGSR